MFPLGFSVREPVQGIWTADLHAQSLTEVADEIVSMAQPNICVFEVGHTVMDARAQRLLGLTEIARGAGIAPVELDIDALLLRTRELPDLLSALSHYDMSLLDLREPITSDQAYEAVIAAAVARAKPVQVVLEHAPASTVYLHSHDDCYLHVEARSLERVLEHFARLLQEFVAAQLELEGRSIGSPMRSLLEDVLSRSGSCTILDVHSREEDGRLILGYSTSAYRLGDAAPEPEGCLIYEKSTAAWAAG